MNAPPREPRTDRRQAHKTVDGVTLAATGVPGEWRIDGSWIGLVRDDQARAWQVITGRGPGDWFYAKTHRRAVAELRRRGLIPTADTPPGQAS